MRGAWTLRILGVALLAAAAPWDLLAITPREPSAPELIAKLGSGDKQTRIDAALWLADFRDSQDVAPALERALKDPDEAVRLCALWALCTIRSQQDRFHPVLREALRGDNEELRWYGAQLAGKARLPEATTALTDLLGDTSARVRGTAALSLGDTLSQSEAVVGALVKALGDEDARVRGSAAHGLGCIRPVTKEVFEALTRALGDKEPAVRPSAAWALRDICYGAEQTRQDLIKLVEPTLIKALGDEAMWVRVFAAGALGHVRTHPDAAVAALVGALDDKEWNMRQAAAQALAVIGPDAKAAVPALLAGLCDKKNSPMTLGSRPAEGPPRVVEAMTKALAAIGEPAVPVLIEAVGHDDKYVRGGAIDALGDIGPPAKAAIPFLEKVLGDREEYVRVRAADALKKIKGRQGSKSGPA